jgi:hypothetical protein
VREEKTVASYDELLGTVEVAPVVSAVLRRTPLTHLLSMSREGPPLQWEDAVFLLRDPELARAIAYAAVRGSEPRQVVAAPARLAAAFEQMLERAPPAADVRAVTAFLVHLNALLALGETGERDLGSRSPLLSAVLSPERASQRPRGWPPSSRCRRPLPWSTRCSPSRRDARGRRPHRALDAATGASRRGRGRSCHRDPRRPAPPPCRAHARVGRADHG